jgi:hypothetical protein
MFLGGLTTHSTSREHRPGWLGRFAHALVRRGSSGTRLLAHPESKIVLPPEASSGNESDDRNSGKYRPDGAIDHVAKLQGVTPTSLVRRPLYVCPDGDSWYLVSDLFEVASGFRTSDRTPADC